MAPESFEPASLYLVVVLAVFGIWLIGDRVWAVAHAIAVRPRHRKGVSVKLVAAVVTVLLAVMSWRVAPATASIIPQQDRAIVQIDPSATDMTLRTLMVPGAVMLPSAGVQSNHGTYVVAAGDCLWRIARSILIADGLPVTGSATSDLWRSIYETNRELIGSNPNLIFPGQVLDLPER